MFRPLGTKAYLAMGLGLLFIILSVAVVVMVNMTMRGLALTDAEDASRMLLDHNLAITTYFSKDLKPRLFEQLGPIMSKDCFEPLWMSSTYAKRKIHDYFYHFSKSPYYYKECAINARSPQNEADDYEKAFVSELQNDPQLTTRSAIRVLDGKPYFTFLRRGEAMEASCLRCHSTPEKAPGDLVRHYGPERSFHRKVDEVVQAISIRIPLSEAFSTATNFSYYLSGLLLVALGGGFLFVWVGNKRLVIDPIGRIQEQAVKIASERESLGEIIPEPKIKELRDLVAAFNKMSVELRKSHDEIEQRVLERTQELAAANQQLEKEVEYRRITEAALRQSEELYRSLFENMLNGLAYCRMHFDDQGRPRDFTYLTVNRAFEMQTGLKDVVGKRVSEVIPGIREVDPELFEIYGRVAMGGQPKRFEKFVEALQMWFWISVYSPEPGYFVAIFDVITERKKAEEEREQLRRQLLQSQKLEAIGTLTGGIAHDFNNLLTIINGYTEMLLLERTEDDPIHEDLQKIFQTGRKGAEMVQRLLTFTKQGEYSPEPMNLNEQVELTKNLLERSFPKMIAIETSLSDDLGTINADGGQIEQLLMNLCINAKDAMSDGGSLRIETRNITVDEDCCRLHAGAKPGPHVLIEVADTGAGMSTETMDRMFDPFFTTKGWDFKKGTGLGLSVAKGIVERHGGWMTCESESGKGTKLKIYFPAIVEEPMPEKLVPAAETVPGSGRILLW